MNDWTSVRAWKGCTAAVAAALLLTLSPLQSARAGNLLGFYMGGAVGQARVEAGTSGFFSSGVYGNFRENHSAYKLMLGMRAVSLFGVEIEYVDLGHPHWSSSSLGFGSADVATNGVAAYGMLYLPIPVPVLDVYVKAGAARLDSRVNASYCAIDTCNTEGLKLTNTGFAAGAGVQLKIGSWALRGEYERFSAAGANPSLLTVGATYWFL